MHEEDTYFKRDRKEGRKERKLPIAKDRSKYKKRTKLNISVS